MGYGKHFEKMYTGSMVGSGAIVYAVWGYAISHMRPPEYEVDLNPVLIGFVLGETPEAVEGAIGKLCAPDPKSRSKEEGGRRLKKVGEYAYLVVNGRAYNESVESQRARWREAKRDQRAREAFGKPMIRDLAPEPPKEPPKEPRWHLDAYGIVETLNQLAGKGFRETEKNLTLISQRLREPGVSKEGVEKMLVRMVNLWKGTPMEEYLRVETLFRKGKFDSYYGSKDSPLPREDGEFVPESGSIQEKITIPELKFEPQPVKKVNPYENRPPQ